MINISEAPFTQMSILPFTWRQKEKEGQENVGRTSKHVFNLSILKRNLNLFCEKCVIPQIFTMQCNFIPGTDSTNDAMNVYFVEPYAKSNPILMATRRKHIKFLWYSVTRTCKQNQAQNGSKCLPLMKAKLSRLQVMLQIMQQQYIIYVCIIEPQRSNMEKIIFVISVRFDPPSKSKPLPQIYALELSDYSPNQA